MNNNVYIPFNVSSLLISRTADQKIPSGNQNHIFARFDFTNDWYGLNKTAIFTKDGFAPIHIPLVDSICQFPNELLVDVGTITISVYAGDRRTVNEIDIEVIKGGYIAGVPPVTPTPNYEYVQTPSDVAESIVAIRWYDDKQQGLIGGVWVDIGGVGGGTTISDAIWRPTVSASGVISWAKSTSATAPASQNIMGPQGIQGAKGDTGPTGPQGPQGIQGIPGMQGDQGPQGIQGEKGDTGSPGAVGPQGPKGDQGPPGEDGKDGSGVTILGSFDTYADLIANVPIGSSGDSYLVAGDLYVWSVSENKWINVGTIQGPQGEQGPQGIPGIQGVQGVQGAPGIAGQDGAKGDTGPQGPQGEKGDTGAAGPEGPAGPTGATGPRGDSFDPADVLRIDALESNVTTLTNGLGTAQTDISGLKSEVSAKWVTLNNTEARSITNASNITSLQTAVNTKLDSTKIQFDTTAPAPGSASPFANGTVLFIYE